MSADKAGIHCQGADSRIISQAQATARNSPDSMDKSVSDFHPGAIQVKPGSDIATFSSTKAGAHL